MTWKIGRLPVSVHPLLPFLWLAAGLTGSHWALLTGFLAFLLHESGHALMARCTGQKLTGLEITPFGAVMEMDGLDSQPMLPAFLTAAGGPLFSLLGCFLASRLFESGLVAFAFAQRFARFSFLLFLINLLPVLPLDGGRMISPLLGRFFSAAAVRRLLTAAGVFAGGLLALVSFVFACRGQIVPLPCFAGLYLIYAAVREYRRGAARYITSLIARRQKLEHGQILSVEEVAASVQTPLRQVLAGISPGKYHFIHILSADGMTVMDTLPENRFCDALLQNPSGLLGDCLSKKSRRENTA